VNTKHKISRATALMCLLLLLCSVVQVYPAAAQTRTPVAPRVTRPRKQYWIHNSPLFKPQSDPRTTKTETQARETTLPNDSFVIDSSGISIPNVCPIVPVMLQPMPDGGTKVAARWDGCIGTSAEVDFEGVIDDTGGTVEGTMTYEISEVEVSIFVLATVATGESLRMGTYNVQFLPEIISSKPMADAVHIAERIKASGYDIIALNEVFNGNAAKTFVHELKGTYPHYISMLEGPEIFDLPDSSSGLMIFSRFPFEDLSQLAYQVPGALCAGSDCTKAAFIEYEPNCEGTDCISDKGAGFVRIRNPMTDRIYNVAFSHMQAAYTGEDTLAAAQQHLATRQAELEQVKEMIVGTLTPTQLTSEEIFYIGDLNVDGDLKDTDLGFDDVDKQNLFEWNQRFGPTGDFSLLLDHLVDTWGFETSPNDRGITNRVHWGAGQDSGARLDTILRNSQSRLCAQHMTLAHNLRWSDDGVYTEGGMGLAGKQELSDHIGVNIDLNMNAPQCKPTIAKEMILVPGLLTPTAGEIKFPGSFQWFRFEEAGTYSFAVEGTPGTDFRVYESTDLSTPVPQYKDEITNLMDALGKPHTLKEFKLPEAPFYVKVFNTDRTKAGNYILQSVKHDCTSKELACPVSAGEQINQTINNMPINTDDTAWFELSTEDTGNLGAQDITLEVDNITPGAKDYFSLEVREADGVTTFGSVPVAHPDLDGSGNYRLAIEADTPDAKKMFMLVKRTMAIAPPYPMEATKFRVGWTTNLNFFFGNQMNVSDANPMNLQAVVTTDSFFGGDDDIYIRIQIDGNGPSDEIYVGQFSSGLNKSLEEIIGVVPFFDNIVIWVREEDELFEGADDHFKFQIQALPLQMPGLVKGEIAHVSDDGAYKLFYNLIHGFDKK
jgi:Endonuclease/Exonuclease/phosphatase family